MSLVALGLTTLVLGAPSARAGNSEDVFLGNDAALTAGAVVSSAHDPSAGWYNPAGLAFVERNAIDVSGTAAVLRAFHIPQFLRARLDNAFASSDADFTELLVVGSALAYARSVTPDITIGFGLYVPGQNDFSTRIDLTATSASRGTFAQTLSLTEIGAEYVVGPSVGVRLADTVRVGASLFGVYLKSRTWLEYTIQATPPGGGMPMQGYAYLRDNLVAYGARAVVGVEWQPTSDLHLGATVRSPTLLLAATEDSQLLSQPPQMAPVMADQSFGRPIEPFVFSLGLSYHLDGVWLAAQADVREALQDLTSRADDHTIVNGRIGAKFAVSPQVSLGAGLFTDRSFSPAPSTFGADSIDYYGGTFGLEWCKRFELAGRPPEEAVVVRTVIALRYAIGVGQINGVEVDVNDTGTNTPPSTSDAIYHQLNVHIGSALDF